MDIGAILGMIGSVFGGEQPTPQGTIDPLMEAQVANQNAAQAGPGGYVLGDPSLRTEEKPKKYWFGKAFSSGESSPPSGVDMGNHYQAGLSSATPQGIGAIQKQLGPRANRMQAPIEVRNTIMQPYLAQLLGGKYV